MKKEEKPHICLLGFDEKDEVAISASLFQMGFACRKGIAPKEIDNGSADSPTPALFLVFDDARKAPENLAVFKNLSFLREQGAIVIVTDQYNEDREFAFYRLGVSEYLEISDLRSNHLGRYLKKALIQHSQLSSQLSSKPSRILLGDEGEIYKKIADNSLDLVTIFSEGLVLSYLSPSVKSILGYEPQELLGKTPFQFFTFEDIEKLSPSQQKANIEKYHFKIKRKDGDVIWFETSFKPFYDEGGTLVQLMAFSRNITKRKRLTFMLAEMQHLAGVGAWEYYLEKDKIYATEEISNIFGIPKDQPLGFKEALSVFSTTSQKMIERELGQSLEYGKSWDMELSFYKNKQQLRWVRTVGRAYSMNGQVYKLGGTLQDISERVNYEDLLHKKQSELKAFVENTPAAIAMFDKNMKYVAATNKWCEDYGIDDKNIIGLPHQDIFPKSTSNWKKIYERCLSGAVEKKEEDKILFPDGKIEWLKWEIRPWYNYKNEIGGLLAMSEIITSRKEAEEIAYLQQKRMKEIYQITSDITGDISDRIRKVIEIATIALGMDRGILGKIKAETYQINTYFDVSERAHFEERAYPLDSTLCNITYSENGVLAINSVPESPYAHHPTIGAIPTASYIGVPIWKGGNKYGTLSFISKHTPKDEFNQADKDFVQLLGQWIGAAIDRRTFEREIVVAKEKAEEASNAKAQFVSTMSHEIRTPLNAVVGITHLLLTEDPKPEQIKNLRTLQFSANNLLALINDILDFSKIESGKIELEEIEYDIKELLERLFSMFEFKAAEKSIDLTMNISDGLPHMVKGDPVRLNQILVNLLSNAIKFTDIGGVNLSVEVVEETASKIEVKFTVTDTGIGIPKDKLSNIFESFTQASADTSRKYGGTGLGLSISKRLAEMQGGELTVESTPGKGSAFTVNMSFEKSLSRPDVKVGELEDKEEVNISGSRILLVEDNEVNQMVANQFLKRKDISSEVADNGLIALEKIKSKQFDLILMDLQMPEMDGFEAAKRIRSYPDTYFKEIPIIALTASTMSEVRRKVFASGMNDFISKPFVPETFYECLYKYLRKEKPTALVDHMESSLNISFEKVMEFAYGEKPFYVELLTKIKDEIVVFNAQVSEAAEKKDTEKVGFLKHRLASSLKILGLSELDEDLEKLRVLLSDPAGPPDQTEPLIRSIGSQCRAVVAHIYGELKKFEN